MEDDEDMTPMEVALRHIIHVAAGPADLSDEVEELISDFLKSAEQDFI